MTNLAAYGMAVLACGLLVRVALNAVEIAGRLFA